MKNPRFLNLITHDLDRHMYSLHRIDPLKCLFYPSSTEAREAAQDPKPNKKKKKKPAIIQSLPKPDISFHPGHNHGHCPPRFDSFSLLGRNGVVFADYHGKSAALYDTARAVFTPIPPANSRKGHSVNMSFPVIQDKPEEDDPSSLYVLDLSCGVETDTCFEVLARHDGAWCWRTLPGPPFLSGGGPPYFRRPTIQKCSYAAVDQGSTICISSMEQGLGTYAYNTASHAWRQVSEWALPFNGKAEYVPELNLWLGLLSDYGNPCPRPKLCAFDLSAMVAAAQQPPTPQYAWDYLDLCSDSDGGDNNKETSIQDLRMLNLGSGKFCIATRVWTMLRQPPYTSGIDDMTTDGDSSSCNSEPDIPMTMDMICEEFLVLTGVKVDRCCGCDGLRMIKHKSRHYNLKLPTKAVL